MRLSWCSWSTGRAYSCVRPCQLSIHWLKYASFGISLPFEIPSSLSLINVVGDSSALLGAKISLQQTSRHIKPLWDESLCFYWFWCSDTIVEKSSMVPTSVLLTSRFFSADRWVVGDITVHHKRHTAKVKSYLHSNGKTQQKHNEKFSWSNSIKVFDIDSLKTSENR